jgi:hypothetical protein
METTVHLDEKLLAAAKQYAGQVRRSLSQVIAEALQEKLFTGNSPAPSGTPSPVATDVAIHGDVQRITGLAPENLDARSVYREHVLKRHQ